MNAVEIEEAVSVLASQSFDAVEFPFAFLTAFGNKETTIKRLRTGASNKSDLGGVLQTSNIHIAVAPPGEVTKTLQALKASPATARTKAKFVLATDGDAFEAEDLSSGETVACTYRDFPDHFGFFLPLAGITTVKQIRENSFDIKATGRLNRLYVQLLKDNPDWGTAARRPEMNHFMARLIFCFFAEDTDIFNGVRLFTTTVERMSAGDSANTHEVISEIFRAMNTERADHAAAKLPRWAEAFPYVNGGLFSGSTEVPRFTKIARSYLLHIGSLDWKKINPDIFGSMIQAVADDEERGALGMHYTRVPNILKVLNPLFLDDLREKLAEAGDNPRKLLNLRNRMARIRVFDPACGSGNFLVIAYKEMRAIEAEINSRRGEPDRRTDIPLTNFRGIELRDFPAEIARLALIIAEYQCDVLYRGQEALPEFLPLDQQNWITCGNALRLDWLSICPPTGTGVKLVGDDLFRTPLDQAQIDFENEGGETFICGNPPYKGNADQTKSQKADVQDCFKDTNFNWKSLDGVDGPCTPRWRRVRCCRFPPRQGAYAMSSITIGLDLAKNVFQVHGVDAGGCVVFRKKLRRSEVLRFFEALPPCLVGMEACATAHHWGRTLSALGHQVRLIPPAYVKAYVRRQKNDAADAQAICEAVSRPTMRFVPVKNAERQSVLVLHRSRDLLVRQRTMLINAVRSHYAEFGLVAPQGAQRLTDLVVHIRSADASCLPAIVKSAMLLMVAQVEALMTQINQLGRALLAWHRQDAASQRLASIPGVGVITATALTATVTDPTHFRSGREFAAFLGLVPRQNSSGGKERLGRISKMGDRYLRKLLVLGATSVIRRARTSTQGAAAWIRSLLERRPARVVTVAMANKTARIAWALLARGDVYRAPSHA